MRPSALAWTVAVGCAGEPHAQRIELEPLPAQVGCGDDLDGVPANGIHLRVGVIVHGGAHERFRIENYTTDVFAEGVLDGGRGEAVLPFADSHNGVFAVAVDEHGIEPALFADTANVLACCLGTCRQ